MFTRQNLKKIVVVFGLVFGFLTPVVGGTAEKTEIVIGGVTSSTGKFSIEGSDALRGMTIWVEEVNAKGGIFVKNIGKRLPIKFINYDDRSDTSACVKLYERLINVDKVDWLLPPWGSASTFAVTALTERNKIPLITASAASEKIFERGFKYIFVVNPLARTMVSGGPNFLATIKDQIKSVAVLYENNLFTLSLKEFNEKGLNEKGFNIVMSEMYPLGCKDFSSILIKVKAINPDALILLNIMPSSIYVTKQLAELDIKPKIYIVLTGPNYVVEFIEGLGKMAENVCELLAWRPEIPFRGGKEFSIRCEKRFGKKPGPDVAYEYVSGQLFEQAVEKAGTLDREILNKTLHSEEFYTIVGPMKYNEAGLNNYEISGLAQVQDGKAVIISPPGLASGKIRFPFRQ